MDGQIRPCILQDVLYVPDLGFQLLSVPALDRQSLKISFESGQCTVSKNDKIVATGTMSNNLYKLNLCHQQSSNKTLVADIELWHRRLAHVDPSIVKDMSKKGSVAGLKLSDSNSDSIICTECVFGKGHRSPIPK